MPSHKEDQLLDRLPIRHKLKSAKPGLLTLTSCSQPYELLVVCYCRLLLALIALVCFGCISDLGAPSLLPPSRTANSLAQGLAFSPRPQPNP